VESCRRRRRRSAPAIGAHNGERNNSRGQNCTRISRKTSRADINLYLEAIKVRKDRLRPLGPDSGYLSTLDLSRARAHTRAREQTMVLDEASGVSLTQKSRRLAPGISVTREYYTNHARVIARPEFLSFLFRFQLRTHVATRNPARNLPIFLRTATTETERERERERERAKNRARTGRKFLPPAPSRGLVAR